MLLVGNNGAFILLFLFHHILEVVDGLLYWLFHELWTVVTLQAESVMLRIALWKKERLVHLLAIEIGEIDAAVVAIVTTTGAHYPLAIAGPRRITVGISLAVEQREVVTMHVIC